MTTIFIQDKHTFKTTRREYTDEGFLKVPGRVAKTGTQKYLRSELGLDGDPSEAVTVYRPEDEVFKDESLSTYDGVDITIRHPDELVNAKNFKKHSTGSVRGSGRRDGDFVVADLIIKDQSAIDDINAGNTELSAGYTAEYIMQDGEAPNGDKYQYLQRDIKINHVAIVPMARAGRQARIFDNQPRDKTMTHKITLDSGRSVEVQDEATALLVSDTIERLNQSIKDADDASQQKQAVIDAQKEEIETLKKATTDDEIRCRVERIAKVKTDAARVAGDSFTTDSVDEAEIMREAMTVARPTTDWADKSQPYIQAAFDMAIDGANKSPEQKLKSQINQIAQDGADNITKTTTDSYDEYKSRFTQKQEA